MIFKVDKGATIMEQNPGLQSNEVFAECTDRELRYIFLLYDIESPYIKMRFKDRKVKAATEAGYRKEKDGKRFDKNARVVLDGKMRRVNAAIQEFRAIQLASNTNFAVVSALKAHIDRVVTVIETADTTDIKELLNLNKLSTGLEELIQTKVNIERILDVDDLDNMEEEEEIRDDISMLDMVNVERDKQTE